MIHDTSFDPVCSLDSFTKNVIFKKEVCSISKQIYYPVKFPDYFLFFIASFRPFHFINWLAKTKSPFWGLVFFSLNFSLSLSIWALEKIIEAPQKKVFLQIFSEMLFFFPLALIIFLLLSTILHFVSILLGGKGSFAQSLSLIGLSSYPIILIFIPWLSPVVLIWWTIVLVLSFQRVHRYRMAYAVICIFFPFLIITSFMFATGFIKLPFEVLD